MTVFGFAPSRIVGTTLELGAQKCIKLLLLLLLMHFENKLFNIR